MIYSYVNLTLNSFVPVLCLILITGYAAYFAVYERVHAMFLGSLIFGLGAIHQIAEIMTWYRIGAVPSPDWVLGDSVETAVYLLAVVLFLLFTFYYRRTRSLLEEKDILLDEMNHRVKNNLQVIQSLLSVYEKRAGQKDLNEILQEVRKKIDSFALLHEQLHEQDDIRQVDARGYLSNLCDELERTKPEDKNIELKTSVEPLRLPVETMISCGLIVSELVTNAFDHAFPNQQEGSVEVRFHNGDSYELEVTDTGTGTTDESPSDGGGGLEIVRSIVRLELQGEFNIRTNGGTTALITFS
jgi:two-component sensor histidine kinase